MFIANSEQTSEKEELEGLSYGGSCTRVRKKTVRVKQAQAQFIARAGEGPGLRLARHLWEEGWDFSQRGHQAGLGAPQMGELTLK